MADKVQKTEPGSECLKSIRAMLGARDYKGAVDALQIYLEEHPKDLDALKLLGYAYSITGNSHDALEVYEQLYFSQPDSLEHQANLGLALATVKRFEDAEPLLNEVRNALDSLKRRSTEQRALLVKVLDGLARICIEQSRLEEARDIAEGRVKMAREDAEGFSLRGMLRLMLERPGPAIADCEKALALNPNDPRYHYNYGFALFLGGREAAAVREFGRFYKSSPESAAQFIYASLNSQFERTRQLKLFNDRMQSKIKNHGILGRSPSMQEMFRLLERVSDTNVTVLLQGDTGTGKEKFAEALHFASPRRGKAFIRVNAAALQDTLIESELFGHKRGAFTGADSNKIGLFQMADGGTLFFDEIAELSLLAQSKILRSIEDQEIRPVGSEKTTQVDVRLIAATNENLQERVNKGLFREDLFYRLDVIQFQIPRLKDRPEDIQLLAEHFVEMAVEEHNRDPKYITPETHELLQFYDWPGNVRRLKNVMERAVILCEGEAIIPDDLPEEVRKTPEKKKILRALTHNLRPDVSATARDMGISREHLHRLIKKHNIQLDKIAL